MLKPGYGTEQLHLGETADKLFALLGKPQRRQKSGSFREHWVYCDSHVECIVSRRTGRVLSLFFSEGNGLIDEEAFGATEDAVRSHLGIPQREGGGMKLMTGYYVGRWLSYGSGIGFDFGEDGRLKTVSVFAPKRVAKRKRAASHREDRLQKIAALRK